MLLNSISYALKDAFYGLEKFLAGKRTPSLETTEYARLNSFHTKEHEASLASGEFLCRARRGENLQKNKSNLEIIKDFVHTKVAPAARNFQSAAHDFEPAATARTKAPADEIPVFGLKASLHASTEHRSFDAWKVAPSVACAEPQRAVSAEQKVATKSWRELSRHTALRLIDHKNTPADVLMELSRHVDPEVRSQVADNRNTPSEAIMVLLKDDDINVRLSLAECYHLGATVLELLTEDENPYVCDRANTTLSRLNRSNSVFVIRPRFEVPEVISLRALA